MASKVSEYVWAVIKHPIVYSAAVAGACIIAQKRFYWYLLETEPGGLVAKIPMLILGVYAVLSLYTEQPIIKKKPNPTLVKLLNPIVWNLVIILATALSILIPYYWQ